jgi:hypothetical protein
MLIVPAHVAVQVVRDMAVEFGRFLDEEKGITDLSLSSGVVIAPMHMPVRLMRDFALELLKKGAKPRAREANTAAVDFQVFTSTAVYGVNIMAMRKRPPYTVAPLDDPDGKPLRLFHRPYTISELDKPLEALHALDEADFPNSQLYPLAAALERGRRRATLFYLYQRSRLKKEHRKVMALVEAIVGAQPQQDPQPWYKALPDKDYAFSATLRDVAELYDFVPAPEGEEVSV